MPEPVQTLDMEAKTLLALESEFDTALLEGDPVALDRILVDGFFLNDLTGSVTDKPGFLTLLKSGDLKFTRIVPHDLVVQTYSDTAVVRGWTEMEAEFQGSQIDTKSRFMHVYVRAPERWRMVAAQGTPMP